MEKNKKIMQHSKVYAIVVTYNGKKWIDKCFGSLVNSSIPLNILAIDNASTDGTPELIRQNYPQVEVIETGQNLGFGKANNIGLKRVNEEEADYAFLLNQDAWIEQNTIIELIEIQKKHNEFGLLSPIPFDGDGLNYDYLYSLYYENGINNQHEYYFKTFEIDFINAAAWLLTNELIKCIGGFHHCFTMYGEDKNYIDRIHFLKKFKVGITKNVKYFHDRKNRYKTDITSEKRFLDTKIKIKAELLDPNKINLKTTYNLIKYYSIIFIKRFIRFKEYSKIIFFIAIWFFKSFNKRTIYVKP